MKVVFSIPAEGIWVCQQIPRRMRGSQYHRLWVGTVVGGCETRKKPASVFGLFSMLFVGIRSVGGLPID